MSLKQKQLEEETTLTEQQPSSLDGRWGITAKIQNIQT
jgi:hypothetical protein